MVPAPADRCAGPVLCVEDDAVTRRMLVQLLKARFHSVLVAKDGQEGLDLFRLHQPGLVIADIRMPRLDGISMAREIRALRPEARIIILTSYGTADLMLAAIEVGVSDYLLKPLDAARFHQAVDKCLRLASLEHELGEAKARTETVLASIGDVFFALDAACRFTYVNPQAERFFRSPRARILGSPLAELFPAWTSVNQELQEALEAQQGSTFECRSPAGDTWHEARLYPMEGGISVYLRDVTREKQIQEHTRFLAFYDQLTGLPNRAQFLEQIHGALAHRRPDGPLGAILVLDLDGFRIINQALGHDTGDRVLQEVAGRLRGCMRGGDTVARLGGDEFALLVDGLEHARHPQDLAERILHALAQDLAHCGLQLNLTASIGISLLPGDGQAEPEALLQAADTARQHSKQRGGNACQVYRPEMPAPGRDHLELQSSMRRSLQDHDFSVEYQPQFDLRGAGVVGVEALLRWRHPDHGLCGPSEFIPMAEQTGQILPLGKWVLETACRQGQAWIRNHGRALRMAVNVSGRQFWQGDLVATVSRALARSGFPPALLELELTESMVMHDVEAAVATMRQLAAMGVRLSIDDFGTGYSSLSVLRSFPVHALKIDQSFVRDLAIAPSAQAICRTIIGLAHTLKLEVLAEGIESPEQLAHLVELGCEYGQGFLFGAPAPAPEAGRRFLGAAG